MFYALPYLRRTLPKVFSTSSTMLFYNQILQLLLTNDLGDEPFQDVNLASELILLLWCQTSLLEDLIQPGQLFGGIRVTLGELLENLHIVFGIFVLNFRLEIRSGQGSFSSDLGEAGTSSELGNDLIQSGNGSAVDIEFATWGTMRAGLLVEELNEIGLCASTSVLFSLLAAFGKELDGWVAGYTLLFGRGL
jgi:hypothetical protein